MKEYIKKYIKIQEPLPKRGRLIDKSSSGRVRPWGAKKMANMLLARTYEYIDPAKARRLRDCSNFLRFEKTEQGLKLKNMNSCRVRLCPICTWRRSLKIYSQTKEILDFLKERQCDYRFVFLTLTVKNVQAEELSAALDRVMLGWNRLTRYKDYVAAVQGSWRGVEITHDTNELITAEMFKRKKRYFEKRGLKVGDKNPNYKMFHPHVHALLAVNKSYFKNKVYLSQEKWSALWKKAAQLDYNPVVDARKVKGEMTEMVAEIAKYAVKDADFLVPDDFNLTVETTAVLDKAMQKRRLSAFGGVFKQAHHELNLDDAEDGDLVKIESERPERETEEGKSIFYAFHTGYGDYFEY